MHLDKDMEEVWRFTRESSMWILMLAQFYGICPLFHNPKRHI
jgi:hypothetical protein